MKSKWLTFFSIAVMLFGNGLCHADYSCTVASPYGADEFAACITEVSTQSGVVTVVLPAETITATNINMSSWSGPTSFILRGAGSSSTTVSGSYISFTGNKDITSEIYGIGFENLSSGRFIYYVGCHNDVKLHDNIFTGAGSIAFETSGNLCGQANGVVYNNTFNNANVTVRGSNVGANWWPSINRIWAQEPAWGSPVGGDPTSDSHRGVIYIEDNIFNGNTYQNAVDSSYAGRWVFRFNNIVCTGESVNQCYYLENHSCENLAVRGSQLFEAYNNDFDNNGESQVWPVTLRSGTGVVFGNVTHGTWTFEVVRLSVHRATTAANEFGKCDGNHTGTVDGSGDADYPCRDQIGIAYDSVEWVVTTLDPLNVSANAQVSKPAIFWNNLKNNGTNQWTASIETLSIPYIQADRDYYIGTGVQVSSSSPFDGSSGVGWGTLSNRPETCTTGVSYWATDQGSWNTTTENAYGVQQNGTDGVLYKCTSTNTWTSYYTPYTYPHPLRTSSARKQSLSGGSLSGGAMR